MPAFSMPQALLKPSSEAIEAIYAHHYCSEPEALKAAIAANRLTPEQRQDAINAAEKLVMAIRRQPRKFVDFDALLAAFNLSTQEGVVLMNLAEALLRVPDKGTVNDLIRDKLKDGAWLERVGVSQSKFVDLAARALHLTGKTIQATAPGENDEGGFWRGLAHKATSPVLRHTVRQVVRKMGDHFVMAPTIERALAMVEAPPVEEQSGEVATGAHQGPPPTYSFDMLGEAALTDADVDRYEAAYRLAIDLTGKKLGHSGGVSIKLSALHPRLELAHYDAVMRELVPRLKGLLMAAKGYGMRCTIDAEEVDRLDLTLAVVTTLFADKDLQDWEGLGLAVQAYQKRSLWVLRYLRDLACHHGKRINIRLVKGAYWDTEIKRAQEKGVEDYPVFTRKHHTDVAYMACASYMLENPEAFLCSFATHNPLTLMSILALVASPDSAKSHESGDRRSGPSIEFQRLHGMGNDVYATLYAQNLTSIPCRVYAPIGPYKELLPYLVRRLLENGANTTIVNRLREPNTTIAEIVEDPFVSLEASSGERHQLVPLPRDIYKPERLNARGFDTSHVVSLRDYHAYTCAPDATLTDFFNLEGVSTVGLCSREELETAFQRAKAVQEEWAERTMADRADILQHAAALMEEAYYAFVYACQLEGKKTLTDAVAEVREAIDFCRYYAHQAREQLIPRALPSVTGESNIISYKGRGVMVCISPWNFPLAIFMGQVVAALVTGNAVLAKPAHQTPTLAAMAVNLLHRAGVPKDLLHVLPSKAADVEAVLLTRPDLAGVLFTGSTTVASHINQVLAQRGDTPSRHPPGVAPGPATDTSSSKGDLVPILPFIAETGGINAMIVDSSALFEQVVKDVLHSGFGTAGQRCSALRILVLQEDIYEPVLTMLKGAMDRLVVGSPLNIATDVPPVIDNASYEDLTTYLSTMACSGSKGQAKGRDGIHVYSSFASSPPTDVPLASPIVAPTLITIPSLDWVTKEVFGPIIHVTSYQGEGLRAVIAKLNAMGYGLTLGIHSRVDSRINLICREAKVGNIYVNRGMTGAIVGSQPFGGQRLSGTGPKAGGPHYLSRLVNEYVISTNTMATGGNTHLMAMDLRR